MADLDTFLRAAKDKGASDEFLVALLRQQGWPERSLYEALGHYYAESTGQPLPEPRSTLESAREAFFHLLAFGTLSSWIFSIGYIWFSGIDRWFPDPTTAQARDWGFRQLSWQIAAVVVSFPVFAYSTRRILRDLTANPEKLASPIRRWLTNIALLVAALVFISNLVTFLAVFLQGELSSRFAAKSFVVLLLSSGVFFYYTRGLGARDAVPAFSWHRRFAWTAAALITLTLVLGFWNTGSPAFQRQRAEDRRRTQDLQRIALELNNRWSTSTGLPSSLRELNPRPPAQPLSLTDPFTAQPYEFIPGKDYHYQLCASFNLASQPDPSGLLPPWSHGAGRHCYALQANQSYPYPISE